MLCHTTTCCSISQIVFFLNIHRRNYLLPLFPWLMLITSSIPEASQVHNILTDEYLQYEILSTDNEDCIAALEDEIRVKNKIQINMKIHNCSTVSIPNAVVSDMELFLFE